MQIYTNKHKGYSKNHNTALKLVPCVYISSAMFEFMFKGERAKGSKRFLSNMYD